MPTDWQAAQCQRGLWTTYDLTYASADLEGTHDELKRSRDDCPGFVRYEWGFSPVQHLDLQQKARERQQRIGDSVVTGALGGIVALLRQQLASLLQKLAVWWPW